MFKASCGLHGKAVHPDAALPLYPVTSPKFRLLSTVYRMLYVRFLTAVVLSAMLSVAAHAQNNSWTNTPGGKWETGANWSSGVAPSANDSADFITNASSKTVTIDATTSGSFPSTMTLSNLTVSGRVGSINTLFLNNAGLTTPLDMLNGLTVGTNGVVLVTDSVVRDDGLSGESFMIDAGTMVLDGALLVTTNTSATMGYSGPGQMTLSNSTWLGQGVYVGSLAGSQGTLTIAGGPNSLSSILTIGLLPAATGTVWLTGGELEVTQNTTWVGSQGIARMTISNGTWLAQNVYVGYTNGGHGTLTFAGGATVLNGYLSLGRFNGGTGAVWLTGGQLTITNNTTDIGDGGAAGGGVGQMTVSNGTWLAQKVYVGTRIQGSSPLGCGTLTIAGGTNTFSTYLYLGYQGRTTGTVWVTGGQTTVTGDIIVGNGGFGLMTVSNGSVTASAITADNNVSNGAIDTNQFILDGGVVNSGGASINNELTFADGDGVDAATYHLLGGVHSFAGGLTVRNNALLSGCGTISGSVVVDPGGQVQADCGGTLTFAGSVTNNGTMRAINGSVLETYGTFVNNGTLDVINGGTNFHGGFVNNGTVLTASSVQVLQVSVSGQDFVVQVPSVTNHTYQLEYTASLTPTNWIETGASQPGTGGMLTFTDPGGATNLPARFYRVDCTAP
jgi:T5SS/PEP-CTERM-associated repeat protein